MRYFKSSVKQPMKYLTSGNLMSRDGFLHNRRTLDNNVLIMVKEGTLFLSQNGVKYELGPNHYIFLPAYEEHHGYQVSSGKLSYLWVHFLFNETISIETKDSIYMAMDGDYIIPEYGVISHTQRAALLFNQLLDLSHQDSLYSNKIIDYALSLLFMEIAQEFLEMHNKIKNNISPNVSRIMEWIKANYYHNITISEIAKEFGYNSDYLSSLFTKTTGTTLIHYINKTRIDISKSLLVNYDVSIKEVAYSCGFSDEKYYMKTFKKLEGMTPTQYKIAFNRKRIINSDS